MKSVLPREDIQLSPLFVQGNSRQIGIALGRHAGSYLKSSVNECLEGEFGQWRGTPRLEALRAAASHNFPDAYAELQGLAAGAELPFEEIFLFNCLADLPTRLPAPDPGCTTFLLPADATRGLPSIIAHNEDACLAAAAPWFIANICRENNSPFISLCYGGRLPGNAFSVNGYGLVQTINDVRPYDRQIGSPRAFLARAILDCENLEAALSLIGRARRASGYHHTLGSAKDGEIYSVEAPSFEASFARVDHPQVHANHLIHGSIESCMQYVVGGSKDRQEFGEELLSVARVDALAVLRMSSQSGRGIAQVPTMANSWHKTIASAVFELAPGEVRWAAFRSGTKPLQSGTISPRPS
jgi:hypothetical protein